MTDVLSARALNRATLARQLLLEPSPLDPLQVVAKLVGLQAQVPGNPYVALWSRLSTFDPDELGRDLVARDLVRSAAIRGTIHLLTADDCLTLWPASRPVLERELRTHRDHAPNLDGVELDGVMAWARSFLDQPRTLPDLKKALQAAFPALDAGAARARLPESAGSGPGAAPRAVGTVAPGDRDHAGGVGRPSARAADAHEGTRAAIPRGVRACDGRRRLDLVARLPGFGPVLEDLEAQLHVVHDESGRALVDLPGAPRPDPDTPAPVRFLPEYDNVLLSHADRTRFFDADVSALYPPGRLGRGHVLVDGTVQATWIVDGDAMAVRHLDLPDEVLGEVAGVAEELASFIGLADRTVRFEGVGAGDRR